MLLDWFDWIDWFDCIERLDALLPFRLLWPGRDCHVSVKRDRGCDCHCEREKVCCHMSMKRVHMTHTDTNTYIVHTNTHTHTHTHNTQHTTYDTNEPIPDLHKVGDPRSGMDSTLWNQRLHVGSSRCR